jgi:hypothetical protein
MRDIEAIQAIRKPDYPKFGQRATKNTLHYLRTVATENNIDRAIVWLNEDWGQLLMKVVNTDKNNIQISQRDATLLISDLRTP